MLPLVPERGQALSNSDRFAAFGALVAAAIQYPFSTQEIVVDSERIFQRTAIHSAQLYIF